jgi:outer membrane lipoprotein-sorting protein
MAPKDSAQNNEEARDLDVGRRKAARYLVPVAVAGVAAATIGLPALAGPADPSLPKITARQLIEKIAASDTQQLSGNVKLSADLGIPSPGGVAGSFLSGGAGGDKDGASAAPGSKLMELASGTHTLRVAADGPDKQRVSILDSTAEYSLIHNGQQIWAYDSKSNQVYHDTSAERPANTGPKAGTDKLPTTPKAFADEALKAVSPGTSVSVDGTAQVAGRDAYQLLIKPKQSGSTIGSVRVVVDAKTGTPLRFTLAPSEGGNAAIDVGFTKVDFSKPAASTFTPPKGAKVTEGGTHRKPKTDHRTAVPDGFKGLNIIGKGWTSIAQFDTGNGQGVGPDSRAAGQRGDVPAAAQGFLDSFGDKVSGKFGSGTVFHTRLVNALLTQGGKVFVGTVDKDALVRAANASR